MKVSIESLNALLKSPLPTSRLVEILEKTEVEVEEVLTSPSWDERIIVAKVLSVKPHPDADRLRLASVDTGSGVVELVCGAPNLAENQIVALAQIGATLPDGLEIRATTLRGVVSNGMLCSARELGVSDEHSGILVLPEGTPVGATLCDIWKKGDSLDIKTPANRWDFLSLVGLAREVAAKDEGNELIEPPKANLTYSDTEIVKVKEKGECKRFVSVKMSVNNSVKSPQWLVDNLEAHGLRSISPVVDITNFVMLETGQPSHAYDAQALMGPLQVRFASPAEEVTTLDGTRRKLNSEDLVIADDNGVVALAGVMGGARTQVASDTTEIILEVANFERTRVRKSALRHGLRTEASARFERSLPLPLPIIAAERLVYLLQEVVGAELIDSPCDQLYGWPWVQQIGLRLRKAEKILGVELDEKQVVTGLKKLGFEVEHFSITKESRKHLGKPYIWGANFREHGESGFDCSYLIDRIYSRIGVHVGHVALGQFHFGRPVEIGELRPGDVVFYEGLIKNSPTDHYYISDGRGGHTRVELDSPQKVGHNGIYIGDNRVVTAIQYERKGSEWVPRSEQGVLEVPLSDFTNDPTYLGARRYVENFNHILAVTVPWWRTDVRLEEDMIEEVVKIIGYDAIEAELPTLPPTNTRAHQTLARLMSLKKALSASGLQEVVTYSFISEQKIKRLGQDPKNFLEIANPLSQEQQFLRRSMLPSHLDVVKNNQAMNKSFVLYEITRLQTPTKSGQLPLESWRLGITAVGLDSMLRLKSVLDNVERYFRATLGYTKTHASVYVAGRQADVYLGNELIGSFGQMSKALSADWGIHAETSFAELLLTPLLDLHAEPTVSDLPDYQFVSRDVSVVCEASVAWADVQALVSPIKNVNQVEYIGVYQDEALKLQNKKRLSMRVQFDLGPNPTSEEIKHCQSRLEQKIVQSQSLGKLEIS